MIVAESVRYYSCNCSISLPKVMKLFSDSDELNQNLWADFVSFFVQNDRHHPKWNPIESFGQSVNSRTYNWLVTSCPSDWAQLNCNLVLFSLFRTDILTLRIYYRNYSLFLANTKKHWRAWKLKINLSFKHADWYDVWHLDTFYLGSDESYKSIWTSDEWTLRDRKLIIVQLINKVGSN